jgi:hypothetical protein
MTHTVNQNHHHTLRDTDRQEINNELQQALVALIDLSLIGKHGHWNVVGPNFRSLHMELDELIDAWRDAADAVGERIAALGGFPDGRAQTVAWRPGARYRRSPKGRSRTAASSCRSPRSSPPPPVSSVPAWTASRTAIR